MNYNFISKDTKKISKIATLVIFLALIRTISEPFRLQYFSNSLLTFSDIKPFLTGSLVASLGAFGYDNSILLWETSNNHSNLCNDNCYFANY
jgi:hypothetical protein